MLRRLTRARLAPILVALTLGAFPTTASAFDNLNNQTLGDASWTSAGLFDATTPVFDNSTFTLEQGELSNPAQHLACGLWGSKTAWVRFRTAVAGRVRVTVDSSSPGPAGFDVFYQAYYTAAAPGTASFNDLVPVEEDCFNGNKNVPDEDYLFGHAVPRDRTVYVQVLSVCKDTTAGPAYQCTPAEQAAAPGGPMTIRVRFTPNNGDGDAVADSLDNCPSIPNSDQADQDGDGQGDGCDADRDGDGRADASDNCATTPNADQRNQDGDAQGDACDGDRDGDRYVNVGDCQPDNAAVNPAAREIPRNRIDDDCRDGDARYPRLKNGVSPTPLFRRGTRTVAGFAKFVVEDVHRGMLVRLECAGARCPYSARNHRVRRNRSRFTVGRELNRRALGVGAKVTVKLTRSGFVGRAIRYRLRRRGGPRKFIGCLEPGQIRPIKKRCDRP